jgi:Bacterial Ig-like domain
VASLGALAIGPVTIAAAQPPADPPTLRITSPSNGSVTNNQTPSFSGTTNDIFNEERLFSEEVLPSEEVKLKIYKGTTAKGTPVQTLTTPMFLDGTWSFSLPKALSPGTYTADAEQEDLSGTGKSDPVTFTVDTTPPQVTLTSPSNGSSTSSGSQEVSGSAGTASGDLPAITIRLFAGATIASQPPQETLVVPPANGSWSATFGGLSPGAYTARAEQRDEAGNVGMSAWATFTVTTPPSPPAPAPPVASFKWFPSAPKTGQTVSLVSTSTDTASPITAFAWAPTSSGAFQAGKPVLSTSFSTAGGHVVRLRVTDGNGRSSVGTETIEVTPRPLTLMQPFPIVRIVGSESSSGVQLSLLTVQAPVGTLVRVTCGGRHCPSRSESLVAVSSRGNRKGGPVLLTFRRFERALRAGVVLEIRVSKPGEIGKYTSFAIRRNKPPARVDACVGPTNPKPFPCPAS